MLSGSAKEYKVKKKLVFSLSLMMESSYQATQAVEMAQVKPLRLRP